VSTKGCHQVLLVLVRYLLTCEVKTFLPWVNVIEGAQGLSDVIMFLVIGSWNSSSWGWDGMCYFQFPFDFFALSPKGMNLLCTPLFHLVISFRRSISKAMYSVSVLRSLVIFLVDIIEHFCITPSRTHGERQLFFCGPRRSLMLYLVSLKLLCVGHFLSHHLVVGPINVIRKCIFYYVTFTYLYTVHIKHKLLWLFKLISLHSNSMDWLECINYWLIYRFKNLK